MDLDSKVMLLAIALTAGVPCIVLLYMLIVLVACLIRNAIDQSVDRRIHGQHDYDLKRNEIDDDLDQKEIVEPRYVTLIALLPVHQPPPRYERVPGRSEDTQGRQ
jgi:hypothetical protein